MKSESPGNGIPFVQGMYFYSISKNRLKPLSMRLAFICKYCLEESQLNFVVSDRFRFLVKHGENYSCRCAECGALNEIHVNRIYARTNKVLLIVSLAFTFGTMIYLSTQFYTNYVSGRSLNIGLRGVFIVAAGLLIPLFIWSCLCLFEFGRIRRFNDHRV